MIPYTIFGSSNSIDLDVLFYVNEAKNIQDSHAYLKELELTIESSKKVNPNIAIVENGVVTWCFKGNADEVNNSVFYTHSLHNQVFPCPITKTVTRDVEAKIARCFRILLSYHLKGKHRKEIKLALKENLSEQLELLKQIDLLDASAVIIPEVDYFKTVAFQIEQTRLLLSDIEIYIKTDPRINQKVVPILNRVGNLEELREPLNEFWRLIDNYLQQ